MAHLYDLFIKTDATQVEVNPFAETTDGKGTHTIIVATPPPLTPFISVYAVDAKINFDDNAAFRQKEIFDQGDSSEEDPREVAATKVGLNYVGMDGNIGCMGMWSFFPPPTNQVNSKLIPTHAVTD